MSFIGHLFNSLSGFLIHVILCKIVNISKSRGLVYIYVINYGRVIT